MIYLKECKYIPKLYAIKDHAIYMKYYPLGSLSEVMKKRISSKENFFRYFLLYDILKGLEYIHSKKIVRSDLKCSNILCDSIDDQVTCIISDFGSAGIVGEELISYTKGYNAPELLKNKKLTFEADIYSLGKLIIEIFVFGIDITQIDISNIDKILNYTYFFNNEYKIIKKHVTKPHINNAKTLFELTKSCLNEDPTKRPKLSDFFEKVNFSDDYY